MKRFGLHGGWWRRRVSTARVAARRPYRPLSEPGVTEPPESGGDGGWLAVLRVTAGRGGDALLCIETHNVKLADLAYHFVYVLSRMCLFMFSALCLVCPTKHTIFQHSHECSYFYQPLFSNCVKN